jgi:hypothetical protein
MSGNKTLNKAPTDPENQSQLSNQGLNGSFVNQANTGVMGTPNAGPQTYNAIPSGASTLGGPQMNGGFGPTNQDMLRGFRGMSGGVSGGINSMIAAAGQQRHNPGGNAMATAAQGMPQQLSSGAGKGGQGSVSQRNFRV